MSCVKVISNKNKIPSVNTVLQNIAFLFSEEAFNLGVLKIGCHTRDMTPITGYIHLWIRKNRFFSFSYISNVHIFKNILQKFRD